VTLELIDRIRRLLGPDIGTVVPLNAGTDHLAYDLGAEHLLAEPDGIRLTGVLDWSDAALADPAHDLGRLYRDLGPEVAGQVAVRLGRRDDDLLERAAFHARCALLEDLAFSVTGGDRRYADAALARLAGTFR
jgi:hypothetical protein